MKKPIMDANHASTASGPVVVSQVVVEDQDAGDADPIACTLCGGPARLCGGVRYCTGGASSYAEQRWLIAIRATYAGLLLTRTPAALWGGALLRLARQLARGRVPASVAELAVEYADPACALPPTEAAACAVAYLKQGDLAALRALEPLRDARAPWLAVLSALGRRAALATPLEGKTFGLIAVLCDRCARRRAKPAIPRLVANVATYDAAIRCPKCGAVAPHPLPGVQIAEPHPVSRCVAGATRRCMAHLGAELDADGLCDEGRAIYDQAVTEVAGREGSHEPGDRDLLDALLRAQRWRPVLPAALLPVLTALAKADPEAARALAHLNGAPLDTEAADPDLVEKLTPRPGLSRVLTSIEEAVEHGVKTFVEALAGTPSNPRSRRS